MKTSGFKRFHAQRSLVTSDHAPQTKSAHHGQGGGGKSRGSCTGPKSFEHKILPVSNCAHRSNRILPPKSMIPIYRGAGVYPVFPIRHRPKVPITPSQTSIIEELFSAEIHRQNQDRTTESSFGFAQDRLRHRENQNRRIETQESFPCVSVTPW
jgi:hypothetical protein